MRYETVLTRSFAILRRKPWLWLLALFAGESGGGGGGGGGGTGGFASRTTTAPGTSPDFSWVPHWLADRTTLFVEIGVAILAVWLVFFVVSCVASGAFIGAVARVDAGQPTSFGTAWQMGAGAFRRVLGLKLLIALAILLPLLLLLLVLLVGASSGTRGLLVGLVLDLPLLVAALVWDVFVGWFSLLALRACVLEERGARAAIAAAWDLLRRRFPRIALTTVIFIAANVGVGIVTSIIYSLVEVPFVGPLTIEMVEGRWSEATGTLLLSLAILVPVSLAVNSAVGAYFGAAWTLAYRRFGVEEQPEEPPLAA
ncbi:MAG: hypothetical protein M3Z98_09295 [Candidatus Dormibacteraeota bacterium]|nr:hypothetical protein [Candidatus Dormibacteraeota bacterium]